MNLERTIGAVVDIVRDAKDSKGAALLIGAGCSVTAGIPAAQGVVKRIEEQFPSIHRNTADKTYAGYMGELGSAQRKKLIGELISGSKINWCHIAIAQLMAHGYVTRILTTNFDPLVARACALTNEFPAIYDFANPPANFNPSSIHEKSVFHLHGQYTGFVLRNTDDELAEHAKRLKPLFGDTVQSQPLIVVGYSGETDPVFQCLAEMREFENTLHWVVYKDTPPAKHVLGQLLQSGKSAFYVSGHDADGFFVDLAQQLGCFPPSFVSKPFTHLSKALEQVADYVPPDQDSPLPILAKTCENLSQAILDYEEKADTETLPPVSQLWAFFLKQDFAQVLEYAAHISASTDEERRNVLAATYFELAYKKSSQAQSKTGKEAARLYDLAAENYSAALDIKADMHEALNNWGSVLSDQAKSKTGQEADRLYALAGEKFAEALRIKPDKHEALNNWGNTLLRQARTKTGQEADRLYALAGEKFAEALRIKPDKHEALYNWGNALLRQARTKTGQEADRLYALAGEKFVEALRIKPDKHEALNNWGSVLSDQAKSKTGQEADRLYALAGEKFAEALRIKPDTHEALNNWGNTLLRQARSKTGQETDRLCALAGEKFAEALRIKPFMQEALNNWGNALLWQARPKTGEEADRLYALAGEKFAETLRIKPDKHETLRNWGSGLLWQARTKIGEEAETLCQEARKRFWDAERVFPGSGSYNLACVASLQNQADECRKWLEMCKQHGKLPSCGHIEQDSDFANVRELPWFKEFLEALRK